jgi:phage gp46-like protein
MSDGSSARAVDSDSRGHPLDVERVGMAFAYVYRLGETGIYKVGKADTPRDRQRAYETISTEPVILYAQIETTDKSALEKFIKHRLQAHRWLDGVGSELYKLDQATLDAVLDQARRWNSETLPKLVEAERLTRQQCDGQVMQPSELVRDLHRELLQWRQTELTAQQEMERIEAELKLMMQTASEIEGVAVWKNETRKTLDQERLKQERRDIFDAYYTRVIPVRPFCPRW